MRKRHDYINETIGRKRIEKLSMGLHVSGKLLLVSALANGILNSNVPK